MTASRKLAAILAAEVVGYSRMMGEDEVGAATLVRERREVNQPIIAAHGGRLFKTMGDGMFIEFPSVVAALECALAVQRQMAAGNEDAVEPKRVLYRMGLHLGDVLVEGQDILGDGVNIAARLESIAEPGGVSISEQRTSTCAGGSKPNSSTSGRGRAQEHRAASARLRRSYLRHRRNIPAPDRPRCWQRERRRSRGEAGQLTESLATDLSRIHGSFVIARNTAFTYRSKVFDVARIGRELNVRYALEGSVQRSGNRMRVNAQLIDAQSGNHLWAERFERPVTDLFEMQDEIVARIANTLNAQLIAVEARRAERAPNPDSMDLYFQGEAWVNKGVTFETMTNARGFFERALALDPANPDALTGMAEVEVNFAISLSTSDRAGRFAAAEAAAAKALSLAPDHALAHLCMGMVLGFTNRAAQGIAEYERALALDRNLAGAHALIGQNKLFIGRAEESEAHVLEALRLSPRDPWAYV
jgi:TolB-like protein/class 3 adenylate cyclase